MTLFQIAFKNVARDRHNYLAYFLSSSFTVLIFFLFAAAVFHPDLSVIQSGSTLSLALFAGNAVIYIFAFLFVGYSAVSFMKARGKQLGIYTIMGMSAKQMRRMLFAENLLVGCLSIVTGIAGGLLFLGLFLKAVRNILTEGSFRMYFPAGAMGLSMLLFLLLFLVIGAAAPHFISGSRVIKLLKSDRSYAKELNVSPVRLLFTVLSGTAVLIFCNPKLADALGSLWIALMLAAILLFSYLLITQGGALLFYFRKKTAGHWKGIRLLSDAETSSSMRENGQVMALNCILMTVGFLAVILLGSMKNNVRSEVEAILPFPYLYLDYERNTRSGQDLSTIDRVLLRDGTGEKIEYTLLYHPFTDAYIRQSDYNQFAYEKITPLAEHEVLMLPGNLKYADSEIKPRQQTKDMYQGLGLTLQKAGQAGQLVNITGAYSQVCVVNDRTWERLRDRYFGVEELDLVRVTGVADADWISHLDRAKLLEEAMKKDDDNYDYSYAFAAFGNYYQVEVLVKSLMVFVGVSVSVLFLIAAASIVYFRLYTTLEREQEKYRSICRLGFSVTELRSVVRRQLGAVLLWPFAAAMLLMYGGVLFFSTQSQAVHFPQVALYSGIFLAVYGIFSCIVIRVYTGRIEREALK